MPDHVAPRIVEKHVRRQVSDNEHNHRQHENETEAIKWKPRPSHEPWVDPLPGGDKPPEKDFERIADDIPQKEHEEIDDDNHASGDPDMLNQEHSHYLCHNDNILS